MKVKLEKRTIISFIIRIAIGIVIIAGFVYGGYLLGGALGFSELTGEEHSILEGLSAVLGNPGAKWWSSYSPITLALSFFVGETVCFAIMLIIRKKVSMDSEAILCSDEVSIKEESIAKGKTINEEEALKGEIKKPESLFNGDFMTFIEDDSLNENKTDSGWNDIPINYIPEKSIELPLEEEETGDEFNLAEISESVANVIEEEKGIAIDPNLYELRGVYSQAQLEAITQMIQYMPNLKPQKIKKIINPKMTPEEISNYITIFYSTGGASCNE